MLRVLLLASLAILASRELPWQTFRASTRVVTIDALVHGKNGEPIRDLHASDSTTATAVLFDRLNTRFEDQVPARAEVIRFLSGIRPEDRVAL